MVDLKDFFIITQGSFISKLLRDCYMFEKGV